MKPARFALWERKKATSRNLHFVRAHQICKEENIEGELQAVFQFRLGMDTKIGFIFSVHPRLMCFAVNTFSSKEYTEDDILTWHLIEANWVPFSLTVGLPFMMSRHKRAKGP